MLDLLKGKKGIIFGALDENSIAWKTALKIHEQGGVFVLSNAPAAQRLGSIDKLAALTKSEVILADITNLKDIENLVDKAQEILGQKFDFVLHSVGMSLNVRKKNHYTNPDYDFTQKGWDVSALSFHKLLHVLYHKEAMNSWGSIVALSYIAAQRVFPNYNDMADNKAFLESIARSFGYFFGKKFKVRVNTISQSSTPTRAGQGVKGFDDFIKYSDKTAPLGNASAEDCANYILSMFSDLTKMVSLQNLFHDGGFSNVGVSQDILDMLFEK